jgi:K+-transporting ATPase ATPase C chain
MKRVLKALRPIVFSFIILTLICGIIYPAVVTGIAQLAFPKQANGSIITVTLKDGTKKDYGSALIKQEFTKPEYLIGRPMGVSNLSPVGKEQNAIIIKRINWWHSFDKENKKDIPADLVMASGSGADPNISPEAAEYQVDRIAKARNINVNVVRNTIKKYTTGRLLGFWGEPAVNVLQVNLALDGLI